jgi:glycosyltransferase involved in cell wall biosynthesis
MRIAAFSPVDLSLPQGHALHVRGLLDALVERGHEITLVTPRPAGEAPPARFRRVEVPVIRFRVLRYWSFEKLGGCILLFRCMRQRPDLIYARQDLYTIAPAIVARLTRVPLVLEVNSEIGEELEIAGTNAIARRISGLCERFTVRRAARVLVLGEKLGHQVMQRTGIAASRVAITPIATHLPAPSDPIATREALLVDPSTFLVGFAGNLRAVQGISVLLDAFARLDLPDLQLWIIGTGAHDAILRRHAARMGQGPIRFFGGVPRDDADRLLGACQILAAPYLREEYDRIAGGPISTKILTYLASDRPVVISDIPYYAWIERIGAGESFPSGDAGALAGRIRGWYARWRDAGGPLRGWPWQAPGPGRTLVASGHTWAHAAERVEGILAAAARGSSGAVPTSAARPGR